MFDLRALRTDPAPFDAAWAKRGLAPQSGSILELDAQLRALQTQLQEKQARRNAAAKQIGELKRSGGDAQAVMDEVAALKTEVPALEEQERSLTAALKDLLDGLPNLPMDDVPAGEDESANVEVRRWGRVPEFNFEPRQHFEIADAGALDMDFERAGKIAGSRFVVMTGELARLDRALTNFMLDLQTGEFGRTEAVVPYLVRAGALYGTSQLPKFEEDLFKTTDDRYLIPTSEVPLTNLVAGDIVEAERLPLRFTAFTPCFRSEAGSAGRDTRGLIRQHQFHKVEMVSVTRADQSEAELELMTRHAEEILQRLGLPYRTLLLCSGDMGFGARKTYDLEVWLPGQGAYREISSCSNCWDFQARRMNARCRAKGEKDTEFVHTLNGSGLAVGRTLVAVLENYQNEDGSVTIPEALIPYMGGKTVIGKSA